MTLMKIMTKKLRLRLVWSFISTCLNLSQFSQTLPVIELRPKPSNARKVTTNDEFKKDSNVWIPQMQNQIRKSGREHEKSTVKKKRNDDVFPCDVSIHKAREVGKLKRDVNEKSQADVTTSNVKKDEKSHQLNHDGDSRDVRAQLRTDVMLVLGKITQYQEKICQYLDYLREIIEDPPEVEDMDDLKKRQKRATEFSNRFARNHLYQIGRIVSSEAHTQRLRNFSYHFLLNLSLLLHAPKKKTGRRDSFNAR